LKLQLKSLELRPKVERSLEAKKTTKLREPAVPYGGNFTPENGILRPQNTYFWDDIV